jgi:hypothetical protein
MNTSKNNVSIDELKSLLSEARKGKAKVDSKYVGFESVGHLFDYKLDFPKFIDNIVYVIDSAQKNKHSKIN